MAKIELYQLRRGGDDLVKWTAPDGNTYTINVSNPPNPPNQWAITYDANQKPVMAYSPDALGSDGTLVVSLDGAGSLAATLLHEEDDTPRKYYFATDTGNTTSTTPLGRWSFILRTEGLSDSPVVRWANFKVMVVVP